MFFAYLCTAFAAFFTTVIDRQTGMAEQIRGRLRSDAFMATYIRQAKWVLRIFAG